MGLGSLQVANFTCATAQRTGEIVDSRLKVENYDGLLLIYDTELGEESEAIGLASRKETVLSDGRVYIKTEITVKPSCPIHLVSEVEKILFNHVSG